MKNYIPRDFIGLHFEFHFELIGFHFELQIFMQCSLYLPV